MKGCKILSEPIKKPLDLRGRKPQPDKEVEKGNQHLDIEQYWKAQQ